VSRIDLYDSDTIVQPYNAMLTMKRLVENVDSVVCEIGATVLLLSNQTGSFTDSQPERCVLRCALPKVVVDNKALDRIVGEKLRIPNPTFEETNSLVRPSSCSCCSGSGGGGHPASAAYRLVFG